VPGRHVPQQVLGKAFRGVRLVVVHCRLAVV
jgi:hypothetical protein